jgi:hypothetical protein
MQAIKKGPKSSLSDSVSASANKNEEDIGITVHVQQWSLCVVAVVYTKVQ